MACPGVILSLPHARLERQLHRVIRTALRGTIGTLEATPIQRGDIKREPGWASHEPPNEQPAHRDPRASLATDTLLSTWPQGSLTGGFSRVLCSRATGQAKME